MARRCTICWHEARPEIEALIKGKVHYTEIGRRFGLNRRAIGRHAKNHMDRALVRDGENEIEPLRLSGSLEERLDAIIEKAAAILAKAERQGSTDTQIRAVAEVRKNVETMGKLASQIKQDSATIQILQVIVAGSENRDDTGHIESRGPDRLLPGPTPDPGTVRGQG